MLARAKVCQLARSGLGELPLEGCPALEESEELVPKAGRQAALKGLAGGLHSTKIRFVQSPKSECSQPAAGRASDGSA